MQLSLPVRADQRLGGALQLVFIRATGRSLARVASVPRSLLKSLCSALGQNETAIVSLKTLYQRRSTLYEHHKWAVEASGLSSVDESALTQLQTALREIASTAASVDDLVKEAELWLFHRRHLLPGNRVLRDTSRVAFASIESAAIEAVKAQVGAPRKLLAALYAKRRGRLGGTVLEWLKTPPAKHGPGGLNEATEKIAFLKSLGVDGWTLGAISNARLRAYSQAVVNRPVSETKKLSDETQLLEVACFLRATLLDLTDSAIYTAGRRVCDLTRHATARVQVTQARSAYELRERHEQIRLVLYAEGRTSDQKIEALKQIVPAEIGSATSSRAALVRQALTDDDARVTALLNAFADLNIKGDERQRPLRQILALRDLLASGAKELPRDFDINVADPVWHELLTVTDRKKALAAFRASTLTSARRGLKGGRLWIDHSWEYRSREDLLIPPEEWKKARQHLLSALSLTSDPKLFLERLHANLKAGLAALAEALAQGKLEIDSGGHVRLPALQAMDIEAEAIRSRDAMFALIGEVQFSDMLVDLDIQVAFSEVLLGSRATSSQELIACYGALLAHGTENDAKGVAAMIPGLQVSHLSAAMRALEAHGRLLRANERLVEFQRQHPIAELWGNGNKASADMISLDASRHLFNVRIEPRRCTFAAGIYTHVLDAYGIFYDQPIVLNERQAAAAVQGVEHYNDARGDNGIRLSLLAVDTHGYTSAAMTVAKLLGFDLCVRLQNLAERKLYVPRSLVIPENLERIAVAKVSERAITGGWDELLRLVASIRGGRLSARDALDKLGSAAAGHPMHRAADELGKLLRTLFLCDYFTNEEFRREIHTLLNRGESVHQLQRAIYYGRISPERGRRRDEMKAISGSHALLTNIVIGWNTMKMQQVVDRWRKDKRPVEDVWLRRMGPVHFANVNFRGTMAFKVERFADVLLHRPSDDRWRAKA